MLRMPAACSLFARVHTRVASLLPTRRSTAARQILSAAVAFGLAACADDQPAAPAAPTMQSSVASAAAPRELIADQYIVVFKGDVADPRGVARGLAQAHGGTVLRTYQHALKGFSVRLPAAAVEALRRNPNVDYVEQDVVIQAIATQSDATWGLDRIDQRDLPLSTNYTHNVNGTGVTVYILDTGIRSTTPNSARAPRAAMTPWTTTPRRRLPGPWHARGRDRRGEQVWRCEGRETRQRARP